MVLRIGFVGAVGKCVWRPTEACQSLVRLAIGLCITRLAVCFCTTICVGSIDDLYGQLELRSLGASAVHYLPVRSEVDDPPEQVRRHAILGPGTTMPVGKDSAEAECNAKKGKFGSRSIGS